MFPYLLFISLTALAGGVDEYLEEIRHPGFHPGAAQCRDDRGVTVGGTVLPGAADSCAGLGVLVGGVLQLGLQLWPLYKLGMFPRG